MTRARALKWPADRRRDRSTSARRGASLAGAGAGRRGVTRPVALFAYALLLPPMRADLAWSYTTAGAMNTVNAVGYLAGALMAPRASPATTHGRAAGRRCGGGAAAGAARAGSWRRRLVRTARTHRRRQRGVVHWWRFARGAPGGAGAQALRFRQPCRRRHRWCSDCITAAPGSASSLRRWWCRPSLHPRAAAGPGPGPGVGGTGRDRRHRRGHRHLAVRAAGGAPRTRASTGRRWPSALAATCVRAGLHRLHDLHRHAAARAGARQRHGQRLLRAARRRGGRFVLALGRPVATLARRRCAGAAQCAAGHGDAAAGAVAAALAAFASGLLFGGVFLQVVAATTALVRHNLPAAAWPAGIGASPSSSRPDRSSARA